MAAIRFADSVFINCPFDPEYWPLFEVIVFTVLSCGFIPRSALEEADGGDLRLPKIARLIRGSRFGIHDLSRIEPDAEGFPRFNMPFELGIDWALKHSGDSQLRTKQMLLLENRKFTVKRCLSDVGGQDPVAHGNSPGPLVSAVRNFLRSASKRSDIPGDLAIEARFREFSAKLPQLCRDAGLNRNGLSFVDYVQLCRRWLVEANNG